MMLWWKIIIITKIHIYEKFGMVSDDIRFVGHKGWRGGRDLFSSYLIEMLVFLMDVKMCKTSFD